jgi:hypothetical protein
MVTAGLWRVKRNKVFIRKHSGHEDTKSEDNMVSVLGDQNRILQWQNDLGPKLFRSWATV